MSKWLASSLNLGLVPERLLVKSQSAYSCAGSSMVERQVVALVMKGFDSLPALIRESSSRLGHQALNLRMLVRIQPPVHVPMRGTNLEKGLQVLGILSGYADRVQGEVSVLHRRVMEWYTCQAQTLDSVGSTPTPATSASVAQWVEQRTLNPIVAGPTPVRGTMWVGGVRCTFRMILLLRRGCISEKGRFNSYQRPIRAGSSSGLERLSYKEEAEGSNPSLLTMFTGSGMFTASATRGGSGRLGTGLQNRSDGFDSHSLLKLV